MLGSSSGAKCHHVPEVQKALHPNIPKCLSFGFRVQGLGFRVWGLGLGFGIYPK